MRHVPKGIGADPCSALGHGGNAKISPVSHQRGKQRGLILLRRQKACPNGASARLN